jgi:hypothetical protein
MLCPYYYLYSLFNKILEIRAKQFLLEARGWGGRRREWGGREGMGG